MAEVVYTSLLVIRLRFSFGQKKKKLLNHQKVSKFYENNCRPISMCWIQWRWLFYLFLAGSTLFGANFIQKIKIINFSWHLTPTIIQIYMQNSVIVFIVSVLSRKSLFGNNFFCFRLETTFLGKIGATNQNYKFKLKFSLFFSKFSFTIQNHLKWTLLPRLIWICTIQWGGEFFCFGLETPFLGKLAPKNQKCQFELNFRT